MALHMMSLTAIEGDGMMLCAARSISRDGNGRPKISSPQWLVLTNQALTPDTTLQQHIVQRALGHHYTDR